MILFRLLHHHSQILFRLIQHTFRSAIYVCSKLNKIYSPLSLLIVHEFPVMKLLDLKLIKSTQFFNHWIESKKNEDDLASVFGFRLTSNDGSKD